MLRKLLSLVLLIYFLYNVFKRNEKKTPRHPSADTIDRRKFANYAILGLQPDANIDTIKETYRNLCRQHHPDTLANEPMETQTRAQEKMAKINLAYSEIRKDRGFS